MRHPRARTGYTPGMPDHINWDGLNQRRRDLETRRDELMQQRTPREEVARVNNAVDQIREVLESTSGDASEVKDKIEEHLGDLRNASAAVREALSDPHIEELTEGVTGGLDTAASILDAANEAIGPVDEALDLLEQAFELADAQPAAQLEALANALEAANERLGPLIERIPGLGQFFELYVLAVRNIAASVQQIEAVKAQSERIWATIRPGTRMYFVPRTAQERLGDEIRELDGEIAATTQQMIELARAEREATPTADGIPEPEVVVRSAESRCQEQRVLTNDPRIQAWSDAARAREAADERLSNARGGFELACQDADRAESALATATSPAARQGSANLDQLRADVAGAHSARASAGELLQEAEANYDEAAAGERAARAPLDAAIDAYRDCVKQQIIGLIGFANRGGGFSDSDFSYLGSMYPQYAVTREEFEAAQPAPTPPRAPAAVRPAASPRSVGFLDRIRAHPIVTGLVVAGTAAVIVVGGLLLGSGGGDSDGAASATATSAAAGGGTQPTATPSAEATATEAAASLTSVFGEHGTVAEQSVAETYGADFRTTGVVPAWNGDVSVRLLRGDDGVIYVDIAGPEEILRTLCGEVDLLQGTAHLGAGIDFCADGASAPSYFEDIRTFDPAGAVSTGHLVICTGLSENDATVSMAIWLFQVDAEGGYEAVEFTAATANVAPAPAGTDFSASFVP